MASVDLARRAEIGREKRARTRERLLAAALAALGGSGREGVTVDEIVVAAGVAKGTFYVHFEDVDALWAELAERLTHDFDELLQARRLSLSDPVERIAYGCAAFLEKARREPAWAAMIARAALQRPGFGAAARSRLTEDLGAALATGLISGLELEMASELATGVVLRLGPLIPGRGPEAVETAVAAILRALGVAPPNASALAVSAAARARGDIEAQQQAR